MPKVRIKVNGGPSPERRSDLLKILCQQDIRIVKLITTYDGNIVITDTEKRARMTLVLKGIDDEILK